MFRFCFLFCVLIGTSGCTVVGVIADNRAGNKVSIGSTVNPDNLQGKGMFRKSESEFSFAQLGNVIDQAIIEFVKEGAEPKSKLVCRQITRTTKECEEVAPPHKDF